MHPRSAGRSSRVSVEDDATALAAFNGDIFQQPLASADLPWVSEKKIRPARCLLVVEKRVIY